MPAYEIQMAAESAADFHEVELAGYHFQSIDSTNDGPSPGLVLITKEVEAGSWDAAYNSFFGPLPSLVDAIALHRLSAISLYGVSVVGVRHDLKAAWAVLPDKRPGTGLSVFGSDHFAAEREEIERLASAQDPSLFFFRHALINPNLPAQVFHLLQCLENIAGETQKPTQCGSCGATPATCENCAYGRDHEEE